MLHTAVSVFPQLDRTNQAEVNRTQLQYPVEIKHVPLARDQAALATRVAAHQNRLVSNGNTGLHRLLRQGLQFPSTYSN